jgi:hypothetical protein
MSAIELSLVVESPIMLLEQLGGLNISVPPITKGRSTQHRERYTMARFLATLAESNRIYYPLVVEHRDKPDFVLRSPNEVIGVECIEAVPEEWYEIAAIAERSFPDALSPGQMFRPGKRIFTTQQEMIEVASGVRDGTPWVGNMLVQQWAEAMDYFIGLKSKKLRSGNYAEFSCVWLLVQDEWRVPMHCPDEIREGAKLCLPRIAKYFEPPCFNAIYVCCRGWLLSFEKDGFTMEPIRDLWIDG